jgi:hypothetical protein
MCVDGGEFGGTRAVLVNRNPVSIQNPRMAKYEDRTGPDGSNRPGKYPAASYSLTKSTAFRNHASRHADVVAI